MRSEMYDPRLTTSFQFFQFFSGLSRHKGNTESRKNVNQILPTLLIFIYIEGSEENMHTDIQDLNGFWEKVTTSGRAVPITLIP